MIVGRGRLRNLDPNVRQAAEWMLSVADYYGVPVEVTSGYRSWEKQTELRTAFERCVAAGNFPSSSCPYPANRPGDSAHNYGWAFDSWVPEEFRPWWTALRQWVGFNVPANDWVHAEVPSWRMYL